MAGMSAAPAGSALLESLRAAAAAGDLQRALELGRARLKEHPQDADAHRHLAQIHAASGATLLARRHSMRACELAPDDPRCWSDFGRVCALADELADAVRCFRESVEIDARHADGWHNLGIALGKTGDREDAFAALKRALFIDPTRAETYLQLGNLLIRAGQFEDAIECFERAARHDAGLASARSRLAQSLSMRGKVRRAESLFRQSLALDPDHVQGWFGLGRALEDIGEAEGALDCYLNVLRRRPDHAPAIGQYLALARGAAGAEVLDAARAVLASEKTPDEARAAVGYGLLKHHDRRKEYEFAAAAGIAANAARRRSAGSLDRGTLTAQMDAIIATCTREFFHARRRWGLGTDQPVFVVGLPRSGTTLTEQILAAHPSLHGAGELPDLAHLAARCTEGDECPWRAAQHMDETQSRVRGGEYLLALRDGAPRGCLRIIDKSPLNFLHLAFIAVLFPSARVIHCRRGARDNALSIWMESFNAAQQYATDFEDLAFFIRESRRLMAHWHEHLPLRILDVRYEDTVADVEGQARRMLEFLGAPWDESCLRFHSSARAVQTPSRWQVRQPVYATSVERWRHYAPWLPQLDGAFAHLSDP
jgi:tetratricopeptide (TPR) repeat protein